jgi:phage shock protein A
MGKVSEILIENEGLHRQLADCEGRAEKLASEVARRIRKYQKEAFLDVQRMIDLQAEILALKEQLEDTRQRLEWAETDVDGG